MSKVMQALERSEVGHQASTVQYQSERLHPGQVDSSASILKPLLIALGLPLVAATVASYQTYTAQKQEWQTNNVASYIVTERPFEYTVQERVNSELLASTFQQVSSELDQDVVQNDSSVTDSVPVEVEGVEAEDVETGSVLPKPLVYPQIADKHNNQNAELFEQLDLSELSPELALRVESALNTSPVETEQKMDAINLSQHPDAWYDRLPAMNFQTHVYSTRIAKRWVKVNGVEYGEGDWIGEVELVAIEQQSCLIRYQGELIEIPALYDWQG